MRVDITKLEKIIPPKPKLDFSKGYRYPLGPGDPVWEAITWFDTYVKLNGRPLTEFDVWLLKQPLLQVG